MHMNTCHQFVDATPVHDMIPKEMTESNLTTVNVPRVSVSSVLLHLCDCSTQKNEVPTQRCSASSEDAMCVGEQLFVSNHYQHSQEATRDG